KEAAFSQFPRNHAGRDYMGYAMRTDRYRYVEWLDAVSGDVVAQELYDHQHDDAENENIAQSSEHAALLARLGEQMWETLARPKFPLPSARQPSVPKAADSQPELTWRVATDQPLPASKPAGEPHNV